MTTLYLSPSRLTKIILSWLKKTSWQKVVVADPAKCPWNIFSTQSSRTRFFGAATSIHCFKILSQLGMAMWHNSELWEVSKKYKVDTTDFCFCFSFLSSHIWIIPTSSSSPFFSSWNADGMLEIKQWVRNYQPTYMIWIVEQKIEAAQCCYGTTVATLSSLPQGFFIPEKNRPLGCLLFFFFLFLVLLNFHI